MNSVSYRFDDFVMEKQVRNYCFAAWRSSLSTMICQCSRYFDVLSDYMTMIDLEEKRHLCNSFYPVDLSCLILDNFWMENQAAECRLFYQL